MLRKLAGFALVLLLTVGALGLVSVRFAGPKTQAGYAVVRAGHPRIFLTSEVLDRLKRKAAAGDPDWRALQQDADSMAKLQVAPYCRGCTAPNTIPYSYQGYGWATAIQTLALAYQVTGRASYADKVIEILKVANTTYQAGNLEPISTDSGYPTRSAAYGLALAFDWVYDRLDATTKAATVSTLNGWYDWFKVNAYQKSGPAYGNYWGGHLLGFGLASLATTGDNPRAEEMGAYIRNLFDTQLPAAFASGGFAGGYPVESFNYGPGHFIRLLQYMWAIKTATGQEFPGATDYAKKIALSLLHNLKPNRWQSSDEGDFPGDYTGVMPANLPLLLASVLEGTTEGQWMQFYYRNLARAPDPASSMQTPAPFDRTLYFDAARPALDYRETQPTVYRSSGDEHVYVRSSWSDDAVWASFAAGGAIWAADHEMRKAGHLAIQRGNDYLLVNSGQWKGSTGVFGNPQAFDLSGWRANTLFFDDSGEYMYAGSAYRGGQGYWGANAVLAFESGLKYVYAKSDLTGSYDRRQDDRSPGRRSLRLFQRSFVYLRPNLFVVFDRAQALKSTYVKKLYFHLNPKGVPVVTGNLTKSVVGDSALVLITLLPAAPEIAVAPDPASNTSETTTYRVEVSDTTQGTDLTALQLIGVTDRNGAMPPVQLVVAAHDRAVGAFLADSQLPRVVLFSPDGGPQREVTYEANYSKAVTGSHLLVDLAPGPYDVFRDGEKILSELTVSSQGLLAFEAAGGAIFSVKAKGPALPPVRKVARSLRIGPLPPVAAALP